MLKEYLEKNYGYNEPIFLNEVRLEGLSDNALRQYFKQMLGAGDLARFDTGPSVDSFDVMISNIAGIWVVRPI